jgi:glycosyltransferase involved in cell wall biosynthesis
MIKMKKKKVLIQSDFSLAKTGFGRHMKSLLSYLYKTNKYEIVHYCCGINYSHQSCQKTPWKSVGCLPNEEKEMQAIQQDQNYFRLASYGAHYLDRVIQEEKPDVYIAVQDFWGVDFAIGRYWWNKFPCAIWTTLDSLPLLPAAVENANKINNYWVWSNFAEKELHRLGHKHVRTIHGCLESNNFCKLIDAKRRELRVKNSIPIDAFIVGFVFRNQLRKSVPNLLEGYSLFRKNVPKSKKTYLFLHTSWEEGWNIPRLAQEYNVPIEEILTTYVCRKCNAYHVRSFKDKEINCPHCNGEKAAITTNVGKGVTEEQLNEIYNFFDVYCHPFTSGGQELPIQEAKLTELITLVTNYSCGEELCEEGSMSLALDWAEYREPGTEFRKASTLPSSIAKQLTKVFEMSPQTRAQHGKTARQWVIQNFSVEHVGNQIEEFIDSCPENTYDFSRQSELKNPNAEIPSDLNDSDFVLALYKNVLNCNTDTNDGGYKYWMQELGRGTPRSSIDAYFRKVATDDNVKINQVDFGELLPKDDVGKRMLFVLPESIGDIFMASSLFKSIKELYPKYNLYVAVKPEYFEILEGNPYVHKVIQYSPQMDNIFWLEGISKHKGYFNIAFMPHFGTQRLINYTHNAEDVIAFDLNYASTSTI